MLGEAVAIQTTRMIVDATFRSGPGTVLVEFRVSVTAAGGEEARGRLSEGD